MLALHPSADLVRSACWLRSLIRALQYKEIDDLRAVVCRNPQVAPAQLLVLHFVCVLILLNSSSFIIFWK